MSKSPEYKCWRHIKDRCLNPNNASYANYGGRGIGIYEGWVNDFQAFYNHIGPKPDWADGGVDRIDNSKGYEPGNIRWATYKQQGRNTRQNRLLEWGGEARTIGEWAEVLGISSGTLQTRLDRGWSVEKSLSQEVSPRKVRRGGVQAFGEWKTLPEWSRISGVPFKTIASRLEHGWSPERAVSEIPYRGKNASTRYIIGTDECGVGCLAGPVAAAAVVWPTDGARDGLGDSKKLSPKRRTEAAQWLREEAPFWAVGFVTPEQVDLHGVHNCRFWLMEMLARRCREVAGELPVLVDGDHGLNLHTCEAIPKGDDLVPAISAASILAKTYRDEYMVLLAADHPEYGFDKHKGYPTKDHRARLEKHGPCAEHRRSFTLLRKDPR